MRFNLKAFLCFLLLFFIEVFIALYVHDKIIRPYIGDVLVIPLIYCFFKAFFRVGRYYLLMSVLLFSFVIELLQKVHFVDLLGLGKSRFWLIVLGNSFHWIDLVAYLAGGLIVYFIDIQNWRKLFSKS